MRKLMWSGPADNLQAHGRDYDYLVTQTDDDTFKVSQTWRGGVFRSSVVNNLEGALARAQAWEHRGS